MKKTIRRCGLSLLALLALGGTLKAQTPSVPQKHNEFKAGFQTGRSFFVNPEELGGQSKDVFFGQLTMDYGVCRNGKVYYGAGIGVDYIDMLNAQFAFQAHAELRYYVFGDSKRGAFVDIQAGYAFNSSQSFPIMESNQQGQMVMVGQIVRKMSGPFGEATLGYRVRNFDFCVGYDYRVINYSKHYLVQNSFAQMVDESYFKTLHTVFVGIGYKIF